jgi:RNA polymerase sigma-70 factor (ECF subfamily)
MIASRAEGGFITAEVDGPDYEALFRREADGLFRALFAFTGGRRAVAEDAVAEAFTRAIAQPSPPRDPLAWIYRTAFRIAVDEHRRDRRLAPTVEMAVDPPELGELIGALRQLTPNQRAVVVLHHVEGLSVKEAALRMGIAAATARVHLHRGRATLRSLLRDEGPES